jgi:hypothetical protein
VSHSNLPTPERIREDISMTLAAGRGFGGETHVNRNRYQETVDSFRNLDSIEVVQYRIPRHRLLGNIASKPFLSSIINKEARTALWLPEPFIPIKVPTYAEIRTIAKTDDFNPVSAVRALFDPSFYGFRAQLPNGELLEEADELLRDNGVDNMRERYQREVSVEPRGLERTIGMDPASSNVVTLAQRPDSYFGRRHTLFMDALEGRIPMSEYTQDIFEEADRLFPPHTPTQ